MGAIGSHIPGGPSDQFVDGIRCLGSGSYLIADNTITYGFENAAGIRLQGNSNTAPPPRPLS
jgi:hypothetical protein